MLQCLVYPTLISCLTKLHLASLQRLFLTVNRKLRGKDKFHWCGTYIPEYEYIRYVFLGQLTDANEKMYESIFAVKSFDKNTSVTAETIFTTITQETCAVQLPHIYSVMADTTALNTGKNLELTFGYWNILTK